MSLAPLAPTAASPVARDRFSVPDPFDLRATVGGLARGRGDPSTRLSDTELWWATATPEGRATLHLRWDVRGCEIVAEAWGDGSPWVLEQVPDLLGLADDIGSFTDHLEALVARRAPGADLVRELHRRDPRVRMSRSGNALEALVPTILEQKVITADARASYRGLVRTFGSPAPGPDGLDLLLPPTAEQLASLPYWAFHPLNVERRRADTVRRACGVRHRLGVGPRAEDDELRRRLLTIPGIGPWTVAEVSQVALGDPDAVSVGDYHLCHHVTHAFTGQRRGSDELMLELLEPFRPHRQRVVRLLLRGTPAPPRRGPRLARSRIRSF